jgi:hypothetical protein
MPDIYVASRVCTPLSKVDGALAMIPPAIGASHDGGQGVFVLLE